MGIDIGRAEAYVAFGELDGEKVMACRVEEGAFWRHRELVAQRGEPNGWFPRSRWRDEMRRTRSQ